MSKYRVLKILLPIMMFAAMSISICNATILPDPSNLTRPNTPRPSGCPEGTSNCGTYVLDDFAQIAINVAQFILGITGSLALLFFIYGGIMFLISGGQSDKINSAKQIIINSLIGIVVIFSAYMIIGFVITKVLKIENIEWYKVGGFNR